MTLFRDKYRVESARLRDWDYASAGWYFVTVCTRKRRCLFGDIADDEMWLSPIGEIVAEEWQRTEQVRPDVELDAWCIMPSHIHGIIVIGHNSDTMVETPRWGVSGQAEPSRLKPHSLSSIVGQFKSVCTKRIRRIGFDDFAWQRRFYDHIIRTEKSLNEIRQYIIYNPAKWASDKENPANL